MSKYPLVDPEVDTFTYMTFHRELAAIPADNAAALALRINGGDHTAVRRALEFSVCPPMPREVLDLFCDVGLGHRLIPVARQDIFGVMRWPSIDLQFLDEDLREVARDDLRHELAKFLHLWASVVPQPIGRCEADGWIGGRMIRRAGELSQMLWPVLYRRFSWRDNVEQFNLFRTFDVQVGGPA